MKAWELMRKAAMASDFDPVADALAGAATAMRRGDAGLLDVKLDMYARARQTFGAESTIQGAVLTALDAYILEEEDSRKDVGQTPAAGHPQPARIVYF